MNYFHLDAWKRKPKKKVKKEPKFMSVIFKIRTWIDFILGNLNAIYI